ncbi:hypothetical protein CE91St30_00980 [Raoultibacter timonensis]|uniref:Zinc ribbon domain-containing protein n=1 Tax=Raoultibacter timonensis TaxID=1907662 RepID=A0ABN6M9S5_9ACTN|nr:hypothetical protein CE91St30_00980 [Raoultibacter timonensis]BDF49368.1 hypothetical protein CE91St31_00980 [Raoultibacter timonensis]
MCFRPAMASAEIKCPRCGHPIEAKDGEVCPKCGLTKADVEGGNLVPKPGGLVPPPPAPPKAR